MVARGGGYAEGGVCGARSAAARHALLARLLRTVRRRRGRRRECGRALDAGAPVVARRPSCGMSNVPIVVVMNVTCGGPRAARAPATPPFARAPLG